MWVVLKCIRWEEVDIKIYPRVLPLIHLSPMDNGSVGFLDVYDDYALALKAANDPSLVLKIRKGE